MTTDFPALLQDGFFAAIAGVGFGLISNPTRQSIPLIALLSAIGHALRFWLMSQGVNIIFAAFSGAFIIGLLSHVLAARQKIPHETISYPALLPMIPGMYAYGVMQAFIKCLSPSDDAVYVHQLHLLTFNAFMTLSIIAMMVLGVLLPDSWKSHRGAIGPR